MESELDIILKNECHRKCVNYIQPAKQIAKNIISHSLEYNDFKSLYLKIKDLECKDSYRYVISRFYSQDMILLQNMKDIQYCYMQPIQFSAINNNIRFVRRLQIPLSVNRFNSSYEFDHMDQILIIGIIFNGLDIQFELIYNDRTEHSKRDINNISEYLFKSFSYKAYLTCNSVKALGIPFQTLINL